MSEKYITKITGKYNFRTLDFQCPRCNRTEEVTLDMRDLPDDYNIDTHEVFCSKDGYKMKQIWKRAPTTFIGGDKSDRRIALMRKSFRERFTKGPEIDDVRHKKGKLFDDSLRSAAATRIKKEEAEK